MKRILSLSGLVALSALVRNPSRTRRLIEQRLCYFWTGQSNYPRSAVPLLWYLSTLALVGVGFMVYVLIQTLA